MVDIQNTDDNPLEQSGRNQFCDYCGCRLRPALFFCPACGTPWKSIDMVTPSARPQKLSYEKLIKKKAPMVWTMFYTYLGTIIGLSFFIRIVTGSSDTDHGMWQIIATVVLAMVTLVFSVIYWDTLVSQLKNFGLMSPYAWVGLAMLVPLLAVNHGYHEFLRYLIELDDPYAFEDMEISLGPVGLIVIYCVFPAITEEVAFRGLVQHWLATAIKPLHAMVLASALFAALHFAVASFPIHFLAGMMLGWVKYKTGSLYPSMVIHGLHNYVVIAYLN